MNEEKKSFFKKLADKFKVNIQPEASPDEYDAKESTSTAPEHTAEPESQLTTPETPIEIASNLTEDEVKQEVIPPSILMETQSAQPEIPTLPAEPIEAPSVNSETTQEIKPAEPTPQAPIATPKPALTTIALHTVRPNETLSHIALRYYGHATPPYYRLIYEFNRNVIGNNMNLIIPGQVLRIPSLPEDFKK